MIFFPRSVWVGVILFLVNPFVFSQSEKSLHSTKNKGIFCLWSLQNGTMGFSVQIKVESTSISLEYKRYLLRHDSISRRYKLTSVQLQSLLDTVSKYKFLETKQPPLAKTAGAPQESITFLVKGKPVTLDMSRVEEIPLAYLKVREKIFELMTKYETDWKKKVGIE